jgi:NADH-quinone oxidoreductase subunit J
MSAAEILFLGFGLLAVLSAIGTVVVHSAIRAAMCLLAHIVSLSGLFLLLHAELLAALQVLVYAGAVVVLFIFVIMLIGPTAEEPPVLRGMVVKTVSVAMMALLTSLLAFSLISVERTAPMIAACTQQSGAECRQFGGVGAFSRALYGEAFVPFELISVLLTVAIVGAIAVARGRTAQEAEAVARKRSEAAAAPKEPALAAEATAHSGH